MTGLMNAASLGCAAVRMVLQIYYIHFQMLLQAWYATTSNRRKLTGAYSDKSPLTALLHLKEDQELALYSNENRVLIFSTALLAPKSPDGVTNLLYPLSDAFASMELEPEYAVKERRICSHQPHLSAVLLLSEESAGGRDGPAAVPGRDFIQRRIYVWHLKS